MHDLEGKPLPEAQKPLSKVQKVSAIIQWLCFFLIYWQLVCHISDNGLECLLCFFYQFLQVINCSIDSIFLKELLVIFPTSVYMVRKVICLDRDDFTKYAVCLKCKKLYTLDECTVKNGISETVGFCVKTKFFTETELLSVVQNLSKKLLLIMGQSLPRFSTL